MKARLTLVVLVIITGIVASGQRPAIELTFTANNGGTHVRLDSIRVINQTQGSVNMIYWPDTTLMLEVTQGDQLLCIGYTIAYLGIKDINNDRETFQLFQNYPNPVKDQGVISIFTPEKGIVQISVTDIQGRLIFNSDFQLDKGNHSFSFHPGNDGLFVLTARCNGISRSIKIISAGTNSPAATFRLFYTGSNHVEPQLKVSTYRDGFVMESGILDSPVTDQTFSFQFATNIPCPGTPTVSYLGQEYNTVQVFSQCWLKENLNVGTMIPGDSEMEDNGIIEKYCYFNEPDSCDKYGGLYGWDEIMQYTTQPGVKGICPTGWHLPEDEEWKVLEGAVDSQYGIGDSIWDESSGSRGYDAGTNLKSTNGWNEAGNGTDLYGFSGLPGGQRPNSFAFIDLGQKGYWWTSTGNEDYIEWERTFSYHSPEVFRSFNYYYDVFGFSVRCLRNEVYMTPIELTYNAVNNSTNVQLDSIKIINLSQVGEAMLYWPDHKLLLPADLPFDHGDELFYIGYAGTMESGILDKPEVSRDYTFQFATNIPCPGMPTVTYEGQVYHTVQVLSQCWLRENINIGTMIAGTTEQLDNGTIEKYCYNNKPDSCIKYGGLYQWHEMMQYSTQPGTQGICPPGWHLPTDQDWKLLEGAADSQYGVGDPEWDIAWSNRGFDAGTNLKTTSGWYFYGNGTDLIGFSCQPGGYRQYYYGSFNYVGDQGYWWTSSKEDEYALYRNLDYGYPGVTRFGFGTDYGFSVRCIRDE